MELGDGLMFELENGKPRIVLSCYGESNASSRMEFCQVPQKNRGSKSSLKQFTKEADLPRDRKCKDTGNLNPMERVTRGNKSKMKSGTNHCDVIGVVRVQSQSKTKSTNKSSKFTEKTLKESVVCLTQEQLQQILNSIKPQSVPENSATSSQQVFHSPRAALCTDIPATREPAKEESTFSEIATREAELFPDKSRCLPVRDHEIKPSDSRPAGLFSKLGERELEKEVLKDKMTQWRKELDEQMTLKKQHRENLQILAQNEQCQGSGSCDQQPGPQRNRIRKSNTENSDCRPAASYTHGQTKLLPAAIRSAFVVGEAAPMEHAFSEEKKEQQRLWLQDLEAQREEAKLRKRLEKQCQNQVEDHDRWAMHFDSFQPRLPVQPPSGPGSDRGEAYVDSTLSLQRAPSQALSTAWDNMSTYGGDSLGRASVDTTRGSQPKSSYLRTMTALLDPAQIEERERKRLKQLEHQRAIEAQVEERRRQREREEAERRALEQKEDRRLALERELLQQQYMKDTQLQRQKEELQSQAREELYKSVQRAQEEAQKDKQRRRIKERSEKDHDVSNQLKSLRDKDLKEDSVSLAAHTPVQTAETPHTDRKDTAVQTELNTRTPAAETPLNPHRGIFAAAEHMPQTKGKRFRHDGRPVGRNDGKENMCTADTVADPYEPYSRTNRTNGQQIGRKTDWKTQRPQKAFVPASERYPASMQKHRQESRMRRQMELMTLVERNTVSRKAQKHTPPQSRIQDKPKDEDLPQVQPSSSQSCRVSSPLVPAVQRRLQQHLPHSSEEQTNFGRPPSSDYVPYVRTDEVYHLDPLAPMSRPPTHEAPQRKHADFTGDRQPTPLLQRDPLLHPELLKSTDRQQAILKGLSELRQGLLQKQRELETSLSPLLEDHGKDRAPAF